MSVQFQGILLKKIRYGEKDLILHLFTSQEGYLAVYVNGNAIRRKAGRVVLEPLSVIEITADKGKTDLWRTKELRNDRVFYRLSESIYKSSMVLFVNEVLVKTLTSNNQDPEFYDEIITFLEYLNQQDLAFENAHLVFMSKLAHYLGFQPNGRFSVEYSVFNLMDGMFVNHTPSHRHFIEGKTAGIFSQLLGMEYSEAEGLTISNKERRAVLDALLAYFRIHIDRFDEVKSRDILEEILQG